MLFTGDTWTWDAAQTYCQTNYDLMSDLYSINMAEKQGWVEATATANSVMVKTWAGFVDDEPNDTWEWEDGMAVNAYDNWRTSAGHPISTRQKMIVRLDQTGASYAKWDSVGGVANDVQAILCSTG